MKKNTILRIIFISIWLLLAGWIIFYLYQSKTPFLAYPQLIAAQVQKYGLWAPVVFILLFAIRPLIFFPATILSLSAGLLFGSYKALLILVIAENLSSLVSYSLGKYVGRDILQKIENQQKFFQKFSRYFHENEFISILTLRLLFAPFDLVGYVAGANGISYKSFALATAIGILPGLITSAFLSGSVYNPMNLLISAFFFCSGFVVSKYVKSRKIHT